jgi:hypothetical protein
MHAWGDVELVDGDIAVAGRVYLHRLRHGGLRVGQRRCGRWGRWGRDGDAISRLRASWHAGHPLNLPGGCPRPAEPPPFRLRHPRRRPSCSSPSCPRPTHIHHDHHRHGQGGRRPRPWLFHTLRPYDARGPPNCYSNANVPQPLLTTKCRPQSFPWLTAIAAHTSSYRSIAADTKNTTCLGNARYAILLARFG